LKNFVTIIFYLFYLSGAAQEQKKFQQGYVPKSKNMSRPVNSLFPATPGDSVRGLNAAYSNYKVKYFVMKKDSSGTNVSSKIYVNEDGRFYLSTENKEYSDESHRIYADETVKINYDDQRFQKKFEGIAVGNAWLFKVVEGKINLYSCYPPPDYVSNECLSAFQVGDGEIEPLEADKLKLALQNNPDALKALEKNDYLKAVKKFNKE
jgi:hypothetical protein